jgi:hypothetical protein
MNDIMQETPRISPRVVIAKYRAQELPEYCGNPLIEALPPIWSSEEALPIMQRLPYFEPLSANARPIVRLHRIERVRHVLQPLSRHLELHERFSVAIRGGYADRNPIKKGFVSATLAGIDKIKQLRRLLDSAVIAEDMGESFCLIGITGGGKSVATRAVLSQYPQVIIHSSYLGRPFIVKQLVWLKLDCPPNGSLRMLCVKFFREVDRLLGTEYTEMFVTNRQSPPSAESMIPDMAAVAGWHHLGVLVIDEMQNLNRAASGGDRHMLNFLVSLTNQIGVPVVYIGTYAVESILAAEFRQARRSDGLGEVSFPRMGANDAESKLLVETLFEYQFVGEKVRTTDLDYARIYDALMDESAGVPSLIVKLYAFAQMRCVVSGDVRLTESHVRSVALDSFQRVRPFLDALRSNDTKKMRQYEDLVSDFDWNSGRSAATDSQPPALLSSGSGTSPQDHVAGVTPTERSVGDDVPLSSMESKDSANVAPCAASSGPIELGSDQPVKDVATPPHSAVDPATNRTGSSRKRKVSSEAVLVGIWDSAMFDRRDIYEAIRAKGFIYDVGAEIQREYEQCSSEAT